MSCNGCRVLRTRCSENCTLRQSLRWIADSPRAQAHATVFVAKFFGRAGLMSFLSSVPEAHRPALFQSLLYEAVGRTINPVTGAVGLLWTGNWHVCQSAVQTVLLQGCPLQPSLDFFDRPGSLVESNNTFESDGDGVSTKKNTNYSDKKRKRTNTNIDHQFMNFIEPTSDESETTTRLENGERKLLRLFV